MKSGLGLLILGMSWAGAVGAATADCCGAPTPTQITTLENQIKAKLPAPLEHYRRYYTRYVDVESDNPRLLQRIMGGVLIAMTQDETGSVQPVTGPLPLLQGEGCVVTGITVTCTTRDSWLPGEAEIARLENSLTLPYGWGAPSRYERYYSGTTDMDGTRRIKAAYLPVNGRAGSLHRVTVPPLGLLLQDLGCSRLNASFDPVSGRLLDSDCGSLPHPPR
jgi:hypothetical protein